MELTMAVNVAITIDALISLPLEDRLKVVEAVWDNLPEQASLPVSPEQRTELERRLDAYEAAPEDLLTWE
jgi:putative addiction module component (TIGR02574 family)